MPTTLTRSLIAALTIVSYLGLAAITSYSQSPKVQVIPAPRQFAPGESEFAISSDTRIVLDDSKSADDRFAAEDFIEDLKQTAGVTLKIGGSGRSEILIGLIDRPKIQRALNGRGMDRAAERLNDEGYLLTVTRKQIVVAGKTAAGTFYGLQTLKELVRGEGASALVPAVRIMDWPTMRWRAVSDDISRGPVPTLEYINRQIRTEASFKLNMHSLYMEHVLRYDSHPLIAPDGGALTPSEVRELVAYARRYHVELVPEQQTFGHMHKALKLEKYNELSEVPYGDVMTPRAEGTYKLVADMYKELYTLFPGEFFHIGADE